MSKKNQDFNCMMANAIPGETVEEQHLRFATELTTGTMHDMLKESGSNRITSITICKEIWLNTNGEGDGLGDGSHYPIFHVYNYIDPSKAASPHSGCRVNPYKEPFLSFKEALKVAKEHFKAALESGKWVAV